MRQFTIPSGFSSSEESHRYLFAQAMEISNDLTLIFDLEGRITFVNEACGRILGCRATSLVGSFLWDVIADLDQIGGILESSLLYGQWSGEVSFRHKSGESVAIRLRTVLIQAKDGEILGIVGVGWDLTSQNEFEEQMLRFERQRLVGEMAAGVAHDFNNVLIGILGYAQLLHGYQDLPQEAKELAGIIKSSAERASELVNRLQWGSSGNVKADPVPVDLNEVVDAGITSSRPKWKNQAESEGRSIVVTTELKAESKIDGQIAEVDEVLTNLIFNAVDAMPEGGEITVRTWDEDTEVCLSVQDTGKGMNEETISRLGEMFFTTKGERGHGLGMVVCNRIVEKMSGKINVTSELNKGTIFTLRFPVGSSKALRKVKTSSRKMPSCDVLVIEDDEAVRSLLVLGLPECQVTSASTGSEGIGYFSANRYDVVLLDLSMPEMNGVEVARQLRGINPQTPVVLMTGWSDPLQGEEDQLFTATLPKPFTISQLRECIAELAT